MNDEFESLTKVRLEFFLHEFEIFKKYIDTERLEDDLKNTKEEYQSVRDIYKGFLTMLEKPKLIKFSQKKQNAIRLATQIRTLKVKDKINNAINILRLQDKEFTHYNIAKEAGVSFVTVKKYLPQEILEQLNKKELEKIE